MVQAWAQLQVPAWVEKQALVGALQVPAWVEQQDDPWQQQALVGVLQVPVGED
jgi:hypothetical protein